MSGTGALSAAERQAIERECERLVLAYARYADTFADEAFADLFAVDGLLHRGDGPVVGRAAIRAAMGKRRRDAIVRHVMTNIVIEVVDASRASGVSYLTLYRSFGSASLPATMVEPEMLAEYHDRFVRTAEGFRIAERRAVIVFKHPASTH